MADINHNYGNDTGNGNQSNHDMDRFDNVLEGGDTVIQTRPWGERELTFLEVTDTGYVRFKNQFGAVGKDLASSWQLQWERGDLERVVDVRDGDSETDR